MSTLLFLMGESGSGKSTSLRNLPPDKTLYIDCDGKGLAWRGWRQQYIDHQNYAKTNVATEIIELMEKVHTDPKLAHIKYLVVDTLNAVMMDTEMRRCKETGYGKWSDLAMDVYYIVTDSNMYRDDLIVILVAESQTVDNEDKTTFTSIKTNGRKLEKLRLERYSNWVVLTRINDNGEHVLDVKARANTTVRTPIGAFDVDEVPNDIMEIIKVMEEY